MGIDLIKGGKTTRGPRQFPRTNDLYLRLLVKLYKFLSRRTGSKFNKVVLKRLVMSRQQKRPISLVRIQKIVNKNKISNDKIIAIVGSITNDNRLLEVPKLRVCALRITEAARKRIVANGGEVMTFDQLAVTAPEGKGVVLLRGNHNTESRKHFGPAGVKGSHSKPKLISKGRKFERARGRRASKGYKRH